MGGDAMKESAKMAWERRQREMGKCIRCVDGVPAAGGTSCEKCRAKRRATAQRWRQTTGAREYVQRNRKKIRERTKLACRRRKERLRSAGLCVVCGKLPPRQQRTLCQGCADREKKYHRNTLARKAAKQKIHAITRAPVAKPLQAAEKVTRMMALVDLLAGRRRA